MQPSRRNPESSLPRVPQAARGDGLTPCALRVAVLKVFVQVLCASHQTYAWTGRSWNLVCGGQTCRYQSSFLPATWRAALENLPEAALMSGCPQAAQTSRVSVPAREACLLQHLVLGGNLLHCL